MGPVRSVVLWTLSVFMKPLKVTVWNLCKLHIKATQYRLTPTIHKTSSP